MNNNIKDSFNKKYSFIPPPQSYSMLRKYNVAKKGIIDWKTQLLGKIPIPFRLMKATQFEKSIVTMSIMFWITV